MDNAHESGTAPSLGVHPGILVPATFPPFERYVLDADGDGFHLFQKAHEPVYANTRARLEEAGHDLVYLRGEDREACLDYVEAHLPHLMEEGDLPGAQLAEWIYWLACRAMERLLAEPDSSERYAHVEKLVDAITQGALRDPVGQWRMLECAPLRHKTNSHSVNVSVLLTGFARTVLRVSDRKILKEVALGGALHDLGKTRIPAAILEKPSELTRLEFAEVKKHPRYGLDMARHYLRKANIARHIIAQHHENACGNGYPDGRAGQSIDLFARVARVVDVFDALTSNRPYSGAIDTYTALNQMVVEMRPQFDMAILRKFIRYLSADWEHDSPVAVTSAAGDEPAEGRQKGADSDALPAMLMGPPLRADVEKDEEPVQETEPQEPAEQEEAPDAAASAGDDRRAEDPTVVVIERHLAPVERAEGRAPSAAAPAGTAPLPDLETRMAAIHDMCDWQDENSALMSGIVRALNQAVADVGPRRTGQTPQPPPAAPAASTTEAARRLFPIIWEIDEWRRTFAAGGTGDATGARMRAEMTACLDALRQSVVEILRDYHVALIENADRLDANLHKVAGRMPGTGATLADAQVQRVGFVQSIDGSYEVLEPALVMLLVGKRRAG